MTDYPAAHSMDTHWFAVDKDGHVGYFDTSENGCMPKSVTYYQAELLDPLELRDPTEALYDRDATVYEDSDHVPDSAPTKQHGRVLRGTVFLDDLDAVQPWLKDGKATQVPATRGFAVQFQPYTKPQRKKLHKADACRGCTGRYHWPKSYDRELDPVALGLFSYELEETWGPGPYLRRPTVPKKPIKVSQLPKSLQTFARQVRFPKLRFADTTVLQPADHTKCQGWGEIYLSMKAQGFRRLDGKPLEVEKWMKEPELAEYFAYFDRVAPEKPARKATKKKKAAKKKKKKATKKKKAKKKRR
jgi:hypothetical protein